MVESTRAISRFSSLVACLSSLGGKAQRKKGKRHEEEVRTQNSEHRRRKKGKLDADLRKQNTGDRTQKEFIIKKC